MDYAVRRSKRARYMRLGVYPDGAVVVVAPERERLGDIERFVDRHAGWIARAKERVQGHEVIRIRRSEIPKLKREALKLASRLCALYADIYGYRFAKISVRAQRSRWGSCSRTGNLSFNYKIAALPLELVQYVIVHEVCHLAAFDHSKRFWKLVSREVPDHRERRARLRRTAFMTI